jgi:uncharacterized protein
MTKRATYMVMIAGSDVTTKLNPHLISLRVSDKVGTHSDTATIELDDTDGRLSLPQDGVPVVVMLGWEEGGVRLVFTGTVDEVRSSGSRSGRTVTVSAKGIDTKSKVKEPQQKHYDKKTVKDVLTEAGEVAGITDVQIDEDLGSIEREYFEQRDESLIHFGERLAREIGGNFRIQGKTMTMSKRMGAYTSFVMAKWGDNLHSWDISPALGRPAYKKTRVRWYDRKEAKWKEQEVEVELDADAESVARYSEPDEGQSTSRAESDKATSERDVAEGSVTIEGDTGAIPDGLCIVAGARSGIDGPYRIESVDHEYSRSGFVTKLELKSAGAA